MKILAYIVTLIVTLAIRVQAATVLCIGLNQTAELKPLKCAENDAAQVAASLTKMGHNAILLCGQDVTRDRIMKVLQDPTVIVYFAGHGQKENLFLTDGKISVQEIAARSAMMFLDCCYVGGTLRDQGNTRVFAAAQFEAFERDGHGVFTKYLLKWLDKGQSFADDGMIEYISKGIRKDTGGWQKPQLGFI